jgi:5-methylcytosine-specific restriction endonuclease McrA
LVRHRGHIPEYLVRFQVSIQLDHINGNPEDNRIENLRLLCPNCHSLTETYGALNIGFGRKNRRR